MTTMTEEKTQITDETENCVWFDGKTVYEVSFCEEFLKENPMMYVDGVFYNCNGAVDVQIIEKMISDRLKEKQVQKDFAKKVTSLVNALRRICYAPDFNVRSDEIHLLNGVLKTDGTFSEEIRICRNRLNVKYNPEAHEPVCWLNFLNELLEPEDIKTLQEFIGYCLIHSTKAQAMLFIVGNGGEGKSRIGVVMYDIFKDAAYFGSITELASHKFLKANLVGKMVLIDDDMNLEGLKDTSFLKSLATSETPLTVQVKGKQGVQVKLKCRTMCFANGTPKSLYDKTDGWERRLIILSAKPVPKDRITDPFLSEKLLGEKEGIFIWGLEGLNRLMSNNFKFTISENAKENIIQMKEDNCNIISFLKDEQLVKFGSELECSTADLYSGYCYWCNLNGVIALKRESFNVWLKQNYHNYNLEYSEKTISHSSQKFARGYKGIDTTFRSVLK